VGVPRDDGYLVITLDSARRMPVRKTLHCPAGGYVAGMALHSRLLREAL
jgi:hypothetical protein